MNEKQNLSFWFEKKSQNIFSKISVFESVTKATTNIIKRELHSLEKILLPKLICSMWQESVSLQGPHEEQHIPTLEPGVICSTGNNFVLWKASTSLHPPPDIWAQLMGRRTKTAHTDSWDSWDSFWAILFQPFYCKNWSLTTMKDTS